jgi:signal transduction histidine kinase
MPETGKIISGVDVLNGAIREVTGQPDPSSVIKAVKRAARRICGAQGITFALRENDQCYFVDEESIAPMWKGKRIPLKDCISGWSILNEENVIIEDIHNDPRITGADLEPAFVRSLAIIPVGASQPVAAIGCYWSALYLPTKQELSLLESLANITALKFENLQGDKDLGELVIARTRELEKANRELESFSYSVSHDLRAPLRGIHGFMNILLEEHGESLSAEAKKMAARVMDNARQMSQLIEGLLEFFKMGTKEVTRTRVPMKEVVSEICYGLNEFEKVRQITFSINDLPDIMADLILVRQVWINLISNAIKYSGKKDNALIEIGSTLKKNETVYFVKDNGEGFDMEYREHLFKVFKRLHSQREFEGTGIGLAIVEKIVTRHGGRVWAEATPGVGATFYFTLA